MSGALARYWLEGRPLVLASASTARAGLLAAAGIPYEAAPAAIDERAVEQALPPGAAPTAVAVHLAAAKARAVARARPGALVLGADQTLAFAGGRLSKPRDAATAREQLLALRGRPHRLASGFALVRDDAVLEQGVEEAELVMRDFSEAFLDTYLDTVGAAALTSVGGYQLEGFGIQLFERVSGDHATILGLPLLPVLAALRRIGALQP